MEQGFLLDRGHANASQEQEWVQGEVERSIWVGIKTKGREKLPVRTFRCPRCGYLESYANETA
ncbi:MAG TPA: hypothetical protein DGD08_18540 [Gemmatimonas aurantiaca]|uniref:Uncharacterized protein n=3 Tax=Gemmatimonas aurantiaca TaxID=173480 RepID=C1ADX2_GEMAT|nr:hypothetical protein GAU_3657 [Gemmatimonas aurantiaca T-27]HCT59204.1 hypothetical protein [Gemmatimonas aurantiaca]